MDCGQTEAAEGTFACFGCRCLKIFCGRHCSAAHMSVQKKDIVIALDAQATFDKRLLVPCMHSMRYRFECMSFEDASIAWVVVQ